MAVFIYKAVTRDGTIVRNRVDELNKYTLMKKLKENKLLPISITPMKTKLNTQNIKKRKKNIEASDSALKAVREQEILKKGNSKKDKWLGKAKEVMYAGAKVKQRDIVIFTQNFFLLKKANFNNIHALSTIIETTENLTLKAIIEDILLGVESGENMYITMEYYTDVFPPIYVNMIKVGELSRVTFKSLRASGKILR
jgi:type II secretory pathway component PulF